MKSTKSAAKSPSMVCSLLDILPDALIVAIIAEWLETVVELCDLDCAITNRLLRSKYLPMKKFVNLCGVKDEKSLQELVSWKQSRNYFIKTLTVYFHQTHPVPPITSPLWKQCSEVESVMFNLIYEDEEGEEYVMVRPTIRLDFPLLLTIFPNMTHFFLGPPTESRSFNLEIDFPLDDPIDFPTDYASKLAEIQFRYCIIHSPQSFVRLYRWLSKRCKNISFIILENCYGIQPIMVIEMMQLFPKLQYVTYEHFHPNADDAFDVPPPLTPLIQPTEAVLTPPDSDVNPAIDSPMSSASDHSGFTTSSTGTTESTTASTTNIASSSLHRRSFPFLELIFHNIPKFYTDSLCEYLFPYGCAGLKELTFVSTSLSGYQKSLLHSALRSSNLGTTLEYVLFQACPTINDYEIELICEICRKQLRHIQLVALPLITDQSLLAIENIGRKNEEENIPTVLSNLIFDSLPKITNAGLLHLLCGCVSSEEPTASSSKPTHWLWHTLKKLALQNNLLITETLYLALFQQPFETLLHFTMEENMPEKQFDSMNVFLYLPFSHRKFRQKMQTFEFATDINTLMNYDTHDLEKMHHITELCVWDDWDALQSILLSGILLSEQLLKTILQNSPKLLELKVDVAILVTKLCTNPTAIPPLPSRSNEKGSVHDTTVQQQEEEVSPEMLLFRQLLAQSEEGNAETDDTEEQEEEDGNVSPPQQQEIPKVLNFTMEIHTSKDIQMYSEAENIMLKALLHS